MEKRWKYDECDRTYGLWNCHWARTTGQRNEEQNQSGTTLIERPQSHHRSQRRQTVLQQVPDQELFLIPFISVLIHFSRDTFRSRVCPVTQVRTIYLFVIRSARIILMSLA